MIDSITHDTSSSGVEYNAALTPLLVHGEAQGEARVSDLTAKHAFF